MPFGHKKFFYSRHTDSFTLPSLNAFVSITLLRRTLTVVMLTVESIDFNIMWNSIIDTVDEAAEGNATENSERSHGNIAKKVAADLEALRVSP
jgi:hypothetical protein